MTPYVIAVLAPLLVAILLQNARKAKKRGLPADVGGEPGYAIRNHRFSSPIETAWEDISTLAELFEDSCKKHVDKPLLGTREVIAKEIEVVNGKSFEKVHLGQYKWLTYSRTFDAVLSFASGLAQLGHQRGERAAIFADTREEWFIALQVSTTCICICPLHVCIC